MVFLKANCSSIYLPLSKDIAKLQNLTHYLIDKPGLVSIKRLGEALKLKEKDHPLK